MSFRCDPPTAELKIIEHARRLGALQDIDTAKYPDGVEAGNQCPYCPDSDQSSDLWRHHHVALERSNNRHGMIGLYGGALLIPPNSPIAHFGEGPVILNHLYIGHQLQKGDTVILYGHAPCGMMGLHGLTICDSLELLGDAKETTREFFERMATVVPIYHESVTRLRRQLGREPTPGNIAVDTKLAMSEVTVMRLLSKRFPDLAMLAHRKTPEVMAHFHVDYGRLDGEQGKKRTYRFDRHAWRSALQALVNERDRLKVLA